MIAGLELLKLAVMVFLLGLGIVFTRYAQDAGRGPERLTRLALAALWLAAAVHLIRTW